MSWSEIKKSFPDGTSPGTFKKALDGLIRVGLARRRNDGKYEATFRGRWALHDPNCPPPSLDSSFVRLMELHGYDSLTPTQQEFSRRNDLRHPKKSIAIFAPPDQGKTLLAELCILEALRAEGNVLYLTPYKALNREKFELLHEIFQQGLDFSVTLVDADNPRRPDVLERSRIVVATYERAAIDLRLRRRWILNRRLVVADEITLLDEVDRGPQIDLFLTELAHLPRKVVVTLSSRVENEKLLAKWLTAVYLPSNYQSHRHQFVVTRSPKSLVIDEIDGPSHSEIRIGRRHWALSILQQMTSDEAGVSLVLSGSRVEAERIAIEVARSNKSRWRSSYLLKFPRIEETNLTRQLNYCLSHGVAFHHAGVPHSLRRAIEDAVRGRSVRVLSATTTLSHGVNLPFASVILNFDSFVHLKRIQYEQFVGRARVSIVGKPVSVYAVTSEQQADRLRKMLTQGLERVVPATLSSSIVERAALDFLQEVGVKEERLIKKVDRLLSLTAGSVCVGTRVNLTSRIRASLNRLARLGFVKNKRGFVQLTPEGMLMRELGLSAKETHQVQTRLASSNSWTDPIVELLTVACGLGIVNEFDYIKDPATRAQLLKAWIRETPLQEIISQTPNLSVRDADIQRLAHDTAQELQSVSRIAESMRLPHIVILCRSLARRLRFGVESDLAETDLIQVKHMIRPLARRLYSAGIKSTFAIYHSNPRKIAASIRLHETDIKPICDAVDEKKNEAKWIRAYRKWRRHPGAQHVRVGDDVDVGIEGTL
jgi:helicase